MPHILNIFPSLLSYGLLAPFVLRVVLGFIVINLGYMKFKSEKKRWEIAFEALNIKQKALFVRGFAYLEIIGGAFLIVGAFTQIAALVFAIITAIELYIEQKEEVLLKRDVAFYVLLFSIAFSLILTGAGSIAIDLPL